MLHAGRSRVRFHMRSLDISIELIILPAALWPWSRVILLTETSTRNLKPSQPYNEPHSSVAILRSLVLPFFPSSRMFTNRYTQTESHLNVSLELNEITLCAVPRTVCNLIITSRHTTPVTLTDVTVHHSLAWERASGVHYHLHCDVSRNIHVYSTTGVSCARRVIVCNFKRN
jgi:hypothetical protein